MAEPSPLNPQGDNRFGGDYKTHIDKGFESILSTYKKDYWANMESFEIREHPLKVYDRTFVFDVAKRTWLTTGYPARRAPLWLRLLRKIFP